MTRSPRPRASFDNRRGFSLIEVLIAAAILSVSAGSLAQLFLLSTSANQRAHTTTYAAMLAQQKMEELRTLVLNPSPSDSLSRNTSGFFDFVDAAGSALDRSEAEGGTLPSGAVYVRRWAVDPLPADPACCIVLRVAVSQGPAGLPLTLVSVARREGL